MEIIEGITLNDLLQRLGIHSSWLLSTLEFTIRILFIAIVAWLTYFIARKWLAKIVVKLAGRTDTRWDDLMFDQRFFNYFAFFITPIVIRMVSFQIGLEYLVVINKIIDIWIVFAVAFLLSVVMDGVNRIYNSYPVARNRPIKVFIQVIKIFVYCVVTVIVFSIILGKDPEALLVGLSAFAAVLMLIFKDAILGFVAGVQLIANKMVNLGDWIVMPSANADGEVLEINLTTVKVQNWDKTISTIPTYKMVSESFTNWRGMEESNGRRIKRSVNIDVQSIHYLTPGEIEQLAKSELLKDYILTKKAELDINYADASTPLDGIRMTNIGTFREYMELWIAQNPNIAQNMTHMVRQLQPGPTGVPLEIYCFSARQKWVEYEKVQSDLFDHLYAVVPLFNLRLFQYPSDKWVAEGDNF
ncbi:mechanosensitive ion channel family protein [Culturomica massiliensis]|jgi:miniconductance mechanosensitive channel|uniref:mechanosensitive ion channel family protein n=1 Tax=Culturomica massiliensis TaxID=1841857 RepID=UPI000E55A8EB|nr:MULTISPECIES: mechanosensitive ion channel domain-containing protein [Odoribacteraceae]RHV97763.1 mechanosensitive ion channel protein MscS [Odoribacter sp. OF09-27XD]